MRGKVTSQPSMLCVGTVEDRVPKGHPLRAIKGLADECLKAMDAQFDAVYALVGRPSVPPERLLKGQLLIALYSVRSERQLCEQLEYNLLFRWFLDMDLVEAVFALHELEESAAGVGEPGDQPLVDRPVDAHDEQPHIAKARRQCPQHLVLVAHLGVGHEHHKAAAGRVGR